MSEPAVAAASAGAFERLGARETLERLRSGGASCVQLITDCMARIAARDVGLEAWQALLPADAALALARERDEALACGADTGPLHGLAVGIKDVIDTADLPTEYGSPIYRGHRPPRDARCVRLLREAGAIVIGKTVTCEFANYPPSRTRNPYDPSRTPGGSSSGSAAAVADGHVAVALGTQTAGSIIRPAAFNGVIGFKPSYSRYAREGVLPLAPSLDTLGFFVRRMEDLALVHSVLRARPGRAAGARAAAPPMIGIARTPWSGKAEPAMQRALEETAATLRSAGAEVDEIELPAIFAEVVAAQELIFAGEAARGFERELREHGELIGVEMRERLLVPGAQVSDARLEDARQLLADARVQFALVMRGVDVLLTPAATGEAPRRDSTGDPVFNRAWTALHAPCLCYPVGLGPHGLPLAVQVVGRLEEDEALLSHAAWMTAHSWRPAAPRNY
jgi:Asp-tRNA(Asn)/Glu-tRNA(Gln) amidotransferase A subunit family amidase